MMKSVFTRYILVFMVIIIVSFSVLALVIGSNMSMTTMNGRKSAVEQSTKNIVRMLGDFAGDCKEENFCNIVDRAGSIVPTYIDYIVSYDENMVILIIAPSGTQLFLGGNTENFVFNGLNSDLILSAASGKEFSGYNDLNGSFGDQYLYYGEPIKNDSGDILAVVFTCTSAKGVNALVVSTIKTLVMASLWVLLAALIAVYFLSERIIGPLKDMSRAARRFAAGNFDVRVPVVGRDEVAELALAFNQMATDLQSLEELRRGFLANVSHDLKTPMTTISGFIDGILEGAIAPENHRQYLQRIKDEILRLSRLVRQLLDLSRIQAGDRKFEFTTFDICEVARQVILSFEIKIDEKKLQVEFICPEDRLLVSADKDAIHQVIYNLCDNAVKFSKAGGVYRIEIKKRDKKVVVSIYNEGQGIPDADLPFVFERFYKSDKSRGLDKMGVGLGLYICKTIIDAHGESILVRSVQNEFCEFEFTLPLAKAGS